MLFKILNTRLLYVLCIAAVLLISDFWFASYNAFYQYTPQASEILGIFLICFFASYLPKTIRRVFFSLCLIFSSAQYFHFQYFGRNIFPNEFLTVFLEMAEVLDTTSTMPEKFFATTLCILLNLSILYGLEKSINKKLSANKYITSLLFLVLIIQPSVMYYYLGTQQVRQVPKDKVSYLYIKSGKHSLVNFYTSLSNLLVILLPKKIQGLESNLSTKNTIFDKQDKILNANVILIIGESIRDDHMSLFSYDRNTTPFISSLAKNNNFFSKEIYSAGIMTKTSVPAIINRSESLNLLDNISFQSCLFGLAKKANYHTSFISGQSDRNLRYLWEMICPKEVNNFLNKSSISLRKNKDEELFRDLELLEELDKIDFKQKQFLVLHLRTAHSPYDENYPEAFELFKNDPANEAVDTYDNSILYFDKFYETLVTRIGKISNKPTYIFFTSDHGEMLGERGQYGHGIFSEEVYTVPFFLYELNLAPQDSLLAKAKHVINHADVGELVANALSYNWHRAEKGDRSFYINGTDVQGYGGYIKAHLTKGNINLDEVKKY